MRDDRGALWVIVLLAAIAGIVAVNSGLFSPDSWRAGVFLATLGLVALSMAAIGRIVNKRLDGLIIDNRNRASLSKLQMLLWTILIVAALTSLAASRLRASTSDPLAIDIPGELLAAMGIAAASFVAAPTVLSLKAGETPSDQNVQDAQASASAQGAQLQANGKVHGRADPSQAQWMDLFRGDEVGNADTPDLSKIQQFAITLLLLGIYTATLVYAFSDKSNFIVTARLSSFDPKAHPGFPNALPGLSDQFVMLMAISHASYLVYKAAPHTSSGVSTSASSADAASSGDVAAG